MLLLATSHNKLVMPPKAKTKVVITKTKPKSPGTTTIATQVMIHNETINSIPASMLVDK